MRRNRLVRLWATWVAVVAVLGFVTPTAAFAGTLTSTSFTTYGTGYAVTGAQNTKYDWAFTTATTNSLQRVGMTVPSGTSALGTKYLQINQNGISATPDSAANSITGDIDLRAQVSNANWSTGSNQTFIAKWQIGTYQSYWFGAFNGQLRLFWSSTATGLSTTSSSANVPFANNQVGWVRATMLANSGGSNLVTFYTSTNGSNWTQLGTTVSNGIVATIYDGPQQLSVGSHFDSDGVTVANAFGGKIYFASVAAGVSGTTSSLTSCSSSGVRNCLNPVDDTANSATWSSSSAQAESWTINRSGSNLPPDIAIDLTASSVSGLPSGGTANYRYLDNLAYYYFPSATAVNASTPCTLALTGFINTLTPGSYTSTMTTFVTGGTAIDSATSAALTFTSASNNTVVSATIDPTFTFAVANQATACNGESNFVSSGGSATGVALGHVSSSANASAGQALTVASNAGGGFNVYIRGTQASQNLRSSTRNWNDVTGTYASPAALGSGEAFGYTYKDSTSSTSVTNPASAMFAALTGTNQAVMGSASSPSGSSCVSFDAQTAPTTPAGTYSATIVYIALPTF